MYTFPLCIGICLLRFYSFAVCVSINVFFFFFLFSLDNMCASNGRFLSLFLFFLKFSPHVMIEGNLEILMEEIYIYIYIFFFMTQKSSTHAKVLLFCAMGYACIT
jgi:hypothetical protein